MLPADATKSKGLESTDLQVGKYLLRPDTQAMVTLALGSATTIASLMCIPDAVGIIPGVPDALTWCIRMLGLWLSAYILWFIGFLGMLYFARFAGGGILMTGEGIKFWRFGKMVSWKNIKAITVEVQPLFSLAFRLPTPARRLLIYEEKPTKTATKLVPHPVPSFQFSNLEFESLFAYVCDRTMGIIPHSLDSYIFLQSQSEFLRSTNNRAALLRKILSVVIAIGLVTFLGRRAGLNYFFNKGANCFRHENYAEAKKEFETATKIDATFAPAWDQLARSEFRSGDIEGAERHWHRALQMKPDMIEAKIGISNILMSRGELVKAKELLDQCARLSPHNCAIYLNQAELYRKLAENERAHQVLEIVEQEGVKDAETLARAAKLYAGIGERDASRRAITRALEVNPQNSFALSVAAELKEQKMVRDEK